jgi:predicted Zn-dependent protease
MTQMRLSRGLLLAVVGILTLASCQGSLPLSLQTSPTAVPGAGSPLAAADAKLYAGDYDGAESAYKSLMGREVAGAGAHYATLLDYEGRFRDAVTQAQQAVQHEASSDALARLSRALDWANDVTAALQVGARAVATSPVAPLAHVFYSEALADSGRLDEARVELQAAEKGASDAYVQAEVDRGWALYDNYASDAGSQLNHILLSIKEQPRFPEREISLARYDLAHQKSQAAQGVLQRLAASNSRNYPVLVSAAESAFLAGDLQNANSLYVRALQVRPGGAEASLGEAEVLVVGRSDFAGAHDLLLVALRGDPTKSDVYEYLRQLDLQVLKRDPEAELAGIAPQAGTALATARKAALDSVNGYRSTVGLAPVTEDPAMDQAAQAHAFYYLFNLVDPALSGLGIHNETSTQPGFTGQTPIARAQHFGYGDARADEVTDHAYTPDGSIHDWIGAPLHRYKLISTEGQVAGYGEANAGAVDITVMDLGTAAPGSGDPVVYPIADQKGVPASFTGNEVPDPLPSGTSYPVGYPVTVAVGGAQKLAVSSAKLLDASGRAVDSYTLAPGDKVGANQWALLAKSPLRSGSRYTVDVSGQVDGQPFSKRWSFTVA